MDFKVWRRLMWPSTLKWSWSEAWVEAFFGLRLAFGCGPSIFARFDLRLKRDIARSRRPQRQVTVLGPIVEGATDLLAVDIPDLLHRRAAGSEFVRHNSLRRAVWLPGFLHKFGADLPEAEKATR